MAPAAASPAPANNIWKHRGWSVSNYIEDCCSCSNSIIEKKISRFDLKMRKRNRLFTDKASHISWLKQRLLSLPPPVHLLGLNLPATAQMID